MYNNSIEHIIYHLKGGDEKSCPCKETSNGYDKLVQAFKRGFKKGAQANPDQTGARKEDVPSDQQRPAGEYDHDEFNPDLTPQQMLERGIFGGRYFNEIPDDLPSEWWGKARRAEKEPDPSLNYYGTAASQPMEVWKEKGWINEDADPKGWFQWFARYHQGRRLPEEDERQIQRWKQFKRHKAQVEKNCPPGDEDCRRRQKQALLHWAYDPEGFGYSK